jgi:hypothetical protein
LHVVRDPLALRKLQSIERRCGGTMGFLVGRLVVELEPYRVSGHGVYYETCVSRPLEAPIVGNKQSCKLG